MYSWSCNRSPDPAVFSTLMTLRRTFLALASRTIALDSGSSGPAKWCTKMKVLRAVYSSKVLDVNV